MKMQKKGVFDQMGALAIGVASLVVIMAIVFLVLAQVRTQAATLESLDYANATQCATSATCNATTTLQTATGTIPNWVPLIILVAVGGLILALVAKFGKR